MAWYLAIVALSFLALLWLTDAFDNSIRLNSHKRIASGLAAIPLACLFIASLLAVAGGVIENKHSTDVELTNRARASV